MIVYRRPHGRILEKRLTEPRRFLQVITGARQVGKTTLVRQVTRDLPLPVRYASADEPTLRDPEWIDQQWEASHPEAREGEAVLVLDEVQKVSGWSESVKRLWDEDTGSGVPLKVVLLGSAPLLMHRGPGESLAGRFEVTHLPTGPWQGWKRRSDGTPRPSSSSEDIRGPLCRPRLPRIRTVRILYCTVRP